MDEIVSKFWEEYHNTDEINRKDKILFIIKKIEDYYLCLENKDLRRNAIASLIQSYFDDLVEIAYNKH